MQVQAPESMYSSMSVHSCIINHNVPFFLKKNDPDEIDVATLPANLSPLGGGPSAFGSRLLLIR